MIRLPVSGRKVQIRLPDGADEMALNEAGRRPIPAALDFLARIATAPDGDVDWRDLTITDFEFLLLRVREAVLGGEVSSHAGCPACREQVEISFRIGDYLARVRPEMPRGVVPAARPGWLMLEGVEFRLPTTADVLAAQAAPRPQAALRARCLAPETAPALGQRIERAIARAAPQASGMVGGACPGCGLVLTALFDVAFYVMTELRRLAAGIYAEVHLLAAGYGWAEVAILALPGARRRIYADMARDSRVLAGA